MFLSITAHVFVSFFPGAHLCPHAPDSVPSCHPHSGPFHIVFALLYLCPAVSGWHPSSYSRPCVNDFSLFIFVRPIARSWPVCYACVCVGVCSSVAMSFRPSGQCMPYLKPSVWTSWSIFSWRFLCSSFQFAIAWVGHPVSNRHVHPKRIHVFVSRNGLLQIIASMIAQPRLM